jgi:hypothetical protein
VLIESIGINASESVFVELDEDHTHVVAAQLLGIWVFAQKSIQHFLQHRLWRLSLQSLRADEVDQPLSVLLVAFPDAVAADHDEVVIAAELDGLDVGVASDGLAVVLERAILFVVVVAEAAGEVEVVVDASALHLRPRGHDALQLQRVLRFVVVGQLDHGASAAQRCPRVPGVGDEELLADQQRHVGSAPH